MAPAGVFTASSREAFLQAASATVPAQRQVVRIAWRSDDGQVQISGSGAARIAPPDSLRADLAGPMGLGRTTMILTGDSVVSEPPGVADHVLPDRFALWAILGVVRAPPGEVQVARAEDGARSLWRTTDVAGRITMFELNNGVLVSVSREEGGRTTSRLRLSRGGDGAVNGASLTDLAHSVRFEMRITSRESSDAFPPETWQLRP